MKLLVGVFNAPHFARSQNFLRCHIGVTFSNSGDRGRPSMPGTQFATLSQRNWSILK